MKITFILDKETIGAIFVVTFFFAFIFALAKLSNLEEADQKKVQYTEKQYENYLKKTL